MHRRARFAYVALIVLAGGLFAWWLVRARRLPSPAAEYAGSSTCAECHAQETSAWRASQHAAAMSAADSASVLGDFNGAQLTHDGATTTFFRRNRGYFVRTPGPAGTLAEFEVRYTFGVYPLQQYLVAFPRGRLQALGLAWDSRPAERGGQKWFALEPGLRPGDPLHWTGIDQNWNYQCADCHSTNLRKNYVATFDSFATSWSEVHVGCESCHGPASNHLIWAKRNPGWRRFEGPGRGLPARLDERSGIEWTIDAGTGNAARSAPKMSDREIEVCARCHSRRGQFSDAHAAGDRFHDAFRPALIEPGLYEADGQQREEVYTYGSFLTSRMYAKGVTCSDCHEPHSGRLRAQGDAVCAPCHAPARYTSIEHHHHPTASEGARCVSCHMPPRTYMTVDPRRDHSFRIPRPDRTITLGTPNACNGCHAERSPEWAAAAIREWYPRAKTGYQGFAEAFAAADRGAPGAAAALTTLLQDRELPSMVRASALARLERFPGPRATGAAAAGVADRDPTVRMAAVRLLANADEAARLAHLLPRLRDSARVVRMDAARALATLSADRLTPPDRTAFEHALSEYVQGEQFNAERPEAHTNLAGLHRDRGDLVQAETELERALELDPTFHPAAVNLADLLRQQGRESEAEQVLRHLLAVEPNAAAAHHALGLSLARQGRLTEATASLAVAARLAPEAPRHAYAYAVALRDGGKIAEARVVLDGAIERYPYDRDLLTALAAYDQQDGRLDRARQWQRRLGELDADVRVGR